MRREPIEVRKATLAQHLAPGATRHPLQRAPGARLRLHRLSARLQDGARGDCFEALGSRYKSGRSPVWLKFKNPEAPAVRREAEEDWGK
jgi:hypothetical protein